MDRYRCCICGTIYTGFGNNAEPYKEGRCCDNCNLVYVIPERLKQVEMREVKSDAQRKGNTARKRF